MSGIAGLSAPFTAVSHSSANTENFRIFVFAAAVWGTDMESVVASLPLEMYCNNAPYPRDSSFLWNISIELDQRCGSTCTDTLLK